MPTPPVLYRVTPGIGSGQDYIQDNFVALLAYAEAIAAMAGGGSAPTNTATVAAAAAPGTVHSGTGLLFGVLVSTQGTAALTITDGAAGVEIAVVPANFPPGWIPFPSPVPYATSIYANSGTGTPAVTVSYE